MLGREADDRPRLDWTNAIADGEIAGWMDSWDSTGCESGIVLHDRSGENSEASQDNILDEVLKGSSCVIATTMPLINASEMNDNVANANGHTGTNSGKSETGAFRPVTRRRGMLYDSNLETGTNFGADIEFGTVFTGHDHQQQQQQIITQGTIGEKRRYENITPKLPFGSDSDPPSSPIATRLRSYNSSGSNGDSPRETLVAARRQPVKLIIHNPNGVRRPSLASVTTNHSNKADANSELDVLPTHPLKRGRMISSGRPSLDFEKMRKRLVVSNVCGIGSQEFVDTAMGDSDKDIENRKHDWALSSSSSGGRRCTQHQQVRCQQTDCTFRPVDSDGTGGGIGNSGGTNNGNNGTSSSGDQ